MLKAGLQKTSLVDYPGIVAAVIFLPYCNFRCPWCQNADLVDISKTDPSLFPMEAIIEILKMRRSVLEGVVITGGEPTLTRELPDLIRLYRSFGYKVKLDTNGSKSSVLGHLFADPDTRPDYIAMDLKRSPHRYRELAQFLETPAVTRKSVGKRQPPAGITRASSIEAEIIKSSALINASGVPHEYRTLVLPEQQTTKEDIISLADLVDSESPWIFSPFKPGTCLDPEWNSLMQTSEYEVEGLASEARNLGKIVYTRGLKKPSTP